MRSNYLIHQLVTREEIDINIDTSIFRRSISISRNNRGRYNISCELQLRTTTVNVRENKERRSDSLINTSN